MTELHAGLELFRDQLRDAVARDLTRRPRRRAVRALIPAAGMAGAAALVLTLSGGAPAPIAEGAIMRHVAAALTTPPASILHERALVTRGSTTAPYELWVESSAPYAYRVLKWGHEGTGAGGDPSDFAAALRAMVQSGEARVDAVTAYAGVPAFKLSISGSSTRFLNGTAYVSRDDYHPLEIDTTDGGGERIVFQAYEYLPATPANLQLLK
jgi:hypothetical protein